MQLKKFKRRRADCLKQANSAIAPLIERLENRQLFDAAVIGTQAPVLAHPASPASDLIALSSNFTDSAITGTVVQFQTTQGTIVVQLTDTATPLTVANFLSYVKSGAYNNTFFHRSVVLSNNNGGNPSAPSDIVQGGGYHIVNGTAQHIATNAPIADEYLKRTSGDIPGTLAMAKTASANSATSEFFFNVHNNVSALDTPTTDSNGVSTSYTVFGTILGNGMTVVNALAALPTADAGNDLTTAPVVNIPVGRAGNARVFPANLTYTQSVSVVPTFTYSAVSDNPQLVNPVVKGSSLSFQYAPNKTGVAFITVTATAVDGTSATETFAVTVPNTAAPAATVVANADSKAVSPNTPIALSPLANDTDSVAAINPGSLLIATQPAHGIATVNTVTGVITYTPAANFPGTDSLQYTVTDTANNVSTPTTFSFTAQPVQVTIGTSTAHELAYTQPNGTVARLTVTDGKAVITFASSDVQTSTVNGVITARGTGATIADITITNTTSEQATIHMTATGTATVGSINDTGSLTEIIAPNTQLTGKLTVGGLGELMLASTNQAFLTIGSGISGTTLFIPTATDTSVVAAAGIDTIRSKQWLNTDGLDDTITAASINALTIAGEFADNLVLSGTGVGLQTAKVGGALTGGAWAITGAVTTLSAKSAAATWSLTSMDAVTSAEFHGNLGGSISATTIGTITVAGDMLSSSITSTAPAPGGYQINKITVRGSISSSTIIANGNMGFIRAGSMTGSQIYAGIDSTTTTSNLLPAAETNFPQTSSIKSIQVAHTFSNSLIAATALPSLHLGTIQTNNNGSADGVAAESIDSLVGALSSGGHLELDKERLKSMAILNAFLTKKQIALHDFNIDIL
jgi:cyclophilin family peptidyl-prolyl cis-trans isomerase